MPHHQPTPEREARANAVVAEATRWAERRADVRALALVGSWARGAPHAESDVDLMVLVDEPEAYRTTAWLRGLDWLGVGSAVAGWEDRTYGAVWSRHLSLADGTEVEFSFGSPSWASASPLEAGTRRVLSGGCRVLHDPEGLFGAALRQTRAPAGAA